MVVGARGYRQQDGGLVWPHVKSLLHRQSQESHGVDLFLGGIGIGQQLQCDGLRSLHSQRQGHQLRLNRLRSAAGCPGVVLCIALVWLVLGGLLFLCQGDCCLLERDHGGAVFAKAMSCEVARSRIHGKVLLQDGGVGFVKSLHVPVSLALAPLGVQGLEVDLLQAQGNRLVDV